MMVRNSFLIAIIIGFYQLAQKPWPWLKGLIFMFQWSQSKKKHGFIYNSKENYKFYYWWQQYSFKYLGLNVSLLLLLAGTYKPFSFYGHRCGELTSQSQAAAVSNRCIIERQHVTCGWYQPPAHACVLAASSSTSSSQSICLACQVRLTRRLLWKLFQCAHHYLCMVFLHVPVWEMVASKCSRSQ